MKKLVGIGIILILVGIIFYNRNSFMTLLYKLRIVSKNEEVVLGSKNEYYRDYDFEYVQNTDDFSPNCFQDILNIYYTVINAGKDKFTFYCPNDYSSCIDDVKELANDQTALSDVNNYVHPYNGFQHIETMYDNYGKVTISIDKSYTDSDIKAVDEKIDYITKNVLKDNVSVEENIKLAHDYIIDNSKYDSMRSDSNVKNYKSDIAYGPLVEGYGMCGGYTDAMELILEYLKVKSYKISSENHIWNGVYINDKWLHLDLTWDDPVISDGSQTIGHEFFLVNTGELLKLEQKEHDFNQNVYVEFKNN